MRQWPVIVNIMRNVPRQDTQPGKYSHLLVCTFKPFFTVAGFRLSSDESWVTALGRVNDESTWDPRTMPFRQNNSGMLQQSLAAEEESAKRRADASVARVNRPTSTEAGSLDGQVLGFEYDDGNIGSENVFFISCTTHAAIGFVNNVLDWCVAASFSKSNSSPPIISPLSSCRAHGAGNNVLAHLSQGRTLKSGKR